MPSETVTIDWEPKVDRSFFRNKGQFKEWSHYIADKISQRDEYDKEYEDWNNTVKDLLLFYRLQDLEDTIHSYLYERHWTIIYSIQFINFCLNSRIAIDKLYDARNTDSLRMRYLLPELRENQKRNHFYNDIYPTKKKHYLMKLMDVQDAFKDIEKFRALRGLKKALKDSLYPETTSKSESESEPESDLD